MLAAIFLILLACLWLRFRPQRAHSIYDSNISTKTMARIEAQLRRMGVTVPPGGRLRVKVTPLASYRGPLNVGGVDIMWPSPPCDRQSQRR